MPRAVSPSSLVSFFTFYDYMTEFTGRAQVKWRSPLVEKRCFWHVALAWNTVLKSLRTLPPAAPTPTFPTNRSKRPSTRTTFQHSREDSATPEDGSQHHEEEQGSSSQRWRRGGRGDHACQSRGHRWGSTRRKGWVLIMRPLRRHGGCSILTPSLC